MHRSPGPRGVRAVIVAAVLAVGACSGGGHPLSDAADGLGTRGSEQPAATAAAEGAVPATAATSTTAPPPDVEVTLAFGGDILTHTPVNSSAVRAGAAAGLDYDFGALLAPMEPVIAGVDLALCHLEAPIAGEGQSITGYPSFHGPPAVVDGIAAAGYDGCSTASNHSLDAGLTGLVATLDRFDAVGLGHTGTARSGQEAAAPRLYEVGATPIAHLSYTYGFNGYRLPDDAPWAANLIDVDRIAADTRTARDAGARLVVVSLHWGSEYRHEPDAQQEEWARAVTAVEGVDLVIGHHAHVVQPIERIDGTWVVFGLGNQLSNQPETTSRDGLTVVVTARGRSDGPLAVTDVAAVPTWVDRTGGHRVLPTVPSLRPDDLGDATAGDLDASLVRTMQVVNSRGAEVPLYDR
ncbi:MAG: CapA family protein [Acidimicrobiales bacterium]|nr:CapA family protein [Acidimicrobiales bacterium]